MKLSLPPIVYSYWRHVLVAVVVIGLGWYFFAGRGTNAGASMTIRVQDYKQQVSVSGTVTAAQKSDLGFATNGRVQAVYAAVGQHVVEGSVLAETENGDLAATLAQAKANLDSLLSGTRPEEIAVARAATENAKAALVDAMRAAYTAADAAVHNDADLLFNTTEAVYSNPPADLKLTFSVSDDTLRLTVERDRALINATLSVWRTELAQVTYSSVSSGTAELSERSMAQVAKLLADANAAVSKAYIGTNASAATLTTYATAIAGARSSVSAATSALTSARSALAAAEKNLQLKEAGATVDAVTAAQAVVSNAEAALAKTRVVAPFTGIVTRMDAKVGEVVSPSTSLIAMQSDAQFEVEVYVPEVAISRIAVGNPATVLLDAYGTSAPFPAKVIAVDPAETVKDGVPTYKTTLAFLAPDSRIRSGMTTNVSIETGVLPGAIIVPAGSIGLSTNGPYVSVVGKSGIEPRSVTTGPSPALGQAQILSGLSEGESILLTPAPYTAVVPSN